MSWLITGTTRLDPDAQSYIGRVEQADQANLEPAVKDAINAFVVGCKADGIWNAIKASCILAGARTLAGALQPLVGTAPTPFAFLPADYNRKTGLVGNGSTKHLNSNISLNSINAAANTHCACYTSTITPTPLLGVDTQTRLTGSQARIRNSSLNATFAVGFLGMTLPPSSALVARNQGVNYSGTGSLTAAPFANVLVLREGSSYGTSRLAFYSIGESLDLALLDARVTALINAFAAAIP